MTLRDRGNIKWTAMMLPEHVERIKQLAKDLDKVAKPIIDEQQLREMELTISHALAKNESLSITYWEDGYYKTIVGKIKYINYTTKQLHMIDQASDHFTLHFDTLINVCEFDAHLW